MFVNVDLRGWASSPCLWFLALFKQTNTQANSGNWEVHLACASSSVSTYCGKRCLGIEDAPIQFSICGLVKLIGLVVGGPGVVSPLPFIRTRFPSLNHQSKPPFRGT